MPFNSNTYHANKYRREALANLAEARRGPPDWDRCDPAEWRRTRARLARLQWRSYLSFRSLQRMNADAKAMRRGDMSPAAFVEKWSI